MAPTPNYKFLSTHDFENRVIEAQTPSVLVFGAKWSGNAEIIDSMVERVSAEHKDQIEFFKVDIEEQAEISKFFGVYSIPTIVMLKEGEVKEFIKGFISAPKLRKQLSEVLLSE